MDFPNEDKYGATVFRLNRYYKDLRAKYESSMGWNGLREAMQNNPGKVVMARIVEEVETEVVVEELVVDKENLVPIPKRPYSRRKVKRGADGKRRRLEAYLTDRGLELKDIVNKPQ